MFVLGSGDSLSMIIMCSTADVMTILMSCYCVCILTLLVAGGRTRGTMLCLF